jgi:hypothetical protein
VLNTKIARWKRTRVRSNQGAQRLSLLERRNRYKSCSQMEWNPSVVCRLAPRYANRVRVAKNDPEEERVEPSTSMKYIMQQKYRWLRKYVNMVPQDQQRKSHLFLFQGGTRQYITAINSFQSVHRRAIYRMWPQNARRSCGFRSGRNLQMPSDLVNVQDCAFTVS